LPAKQILITQKISLLKTGKLKAGDQSVYISPKSSSKIVFGLVQKMEQWVKVKDIK
jgi:hypothetical protein